MASPTWLAVFLVVSLYSCEAYKVLVIFPFPGKSHGFLGDGYVRVLLDAGHEVTYITPFPKKNPNPKLHQVDVSSNLNIFPAQMFNVTALLSKEVTFNDLFGVMKRMQDVTKSTVNNENVQNLLNDQNVMFDVVIIEWFLNEALTGFAAVYDCPFIWSSSVEPHSMVLRLIDEVLNPAYNTNPHSSLSPPFTFIERVTELVLHSLITGFEAFLMSPSEAKLYEELFSPLLAKRQRILPSFDSVRYNASFILGNSHVSLGQATRLPQNYASIGGYHIDPDVKPLPEDLKKLMDNAKNGVIYFSLGSNLKSKDIPDTLKRNIMKIFGELKYTVIWKFEEVLPNLPNNVHILKWAPQPSILSHPKCVLFITHGGLLSTTETVHFGVPIIGVPVFADQFLNIDRAVKRGYAIRVDLSYTMAEELKEAIDEILGTNKYREKVKELSQVYHDRPVSPGAELVHWVQHVVRTRGALHLRSPALLTPWYQKMYLDLAALVLALILVLHYAFMLLFCRKKVNKDKKNK